MPMPNSLEELVRHQERTRTIADRTLALLADGSGAARAKLCQARWEAIRVLREYQLYKHHRIFNPLIGAHNGRSFMAECMKAECNKLGDAFNAYVVRWGIDRIDKDWAGYCRETETIFTAVRRHIEREKRDIARLLSIESNKAASPVQAARIEPPAPVGVP